MATDGPTPPPCDQEIFENGEPVLVFHAPSNAAENWVKSVAEKAQARVDWHYSGGDAQMLHLGDDESRARVEAAIDELEPTLQGNITRRYTPNEQGLYRQEVTHAPDGAVAGFMDSDSGKTFYVVETK